MCLQPARLKRSPRFFLPTLSAVLFPVASHPSSINLVLSAPLSSFYYSSASVYSQVPTNRLCIPGLCRSFRPFVFLIFDSESPPLYFTFFINLPSARKKSFPRHGSFRLRSQRLFTAFPELLSFSLPPSPSLRHATIIPCPQPIYQNSSLLACPYLRTEIISASQRS